MNAFLFLFNTFVLHASKLANFCDTVTSNEWTYTQKWVNKCRIMDDAQIKDKKQISPRIKIIWSMRWLMMQVGDFRFISGILFKITL